MRVKSTNVFKVFRFVDDYLVLFDLSTSRKADVADVLTIFQEVLHPLLITHETVTDNTIRFLDLKLTLSDEHTCWMYEPRANKPLLQYDSAHSKLVKRSIAKLCFTNALKKSCSHATTESLNRQALRLTDAGFPKFLLTSILEGLLRKEHTSEQSTCRLAAQKQKTAVVPYLHTISHNLKKIAQRANVRVAFSAPDKLSKICRITDPNRKKVAACTIKHKIKFVQCTVNVVYRVPLSCGKLYIGQTGRCLNSRLSEHKYNVEKYQQGNLAHHCSRCGCVPLFVKSSVVAKNREQITREIIEADLIDKLGDQCVSTPSIALLHKEKDFLRMM